MRERGGAADPVVPTIEAGPRSWRSEAVIEGWDRMRMLPRLIAIAPEELADDSREGGVVVMRRLAQALRGERMRGRAGHWSYSLDRHIGLVQALAAERRRTAGRGGDATGAGDRAAARTDGAMP